MKSKILIADDSETIRKITKITLASEDYDIVECITESDLQNAIQSERPDLVLLDFNLSESKTGYDLVADMREIHPVKVIMFYGTFDTVDENLNQSLGINGSIVKPFDPTKFINLIRDILNSDEVQSTEPELAESTPVDVGDEWVVNQPDFEEEFDEEDELTPDNIITDQEKDQLTAGIEDWGMAVPNIISDSEEKIEMPPIIAGDSSEPLESWEEDTTQINMAELESQHEFVDEEVLEQPTAEAPSENSATEEEEAVPSDIDLEYPDVDMIKEQVAKEAPKLMPMDELNDIQEEDEVLPSDGIELDATAGTSTIEEVQALEDQIADEVDEEDDLWSADEEVEDPDAHLYQEPEIVGRRKEDTVTNIKAQPVNTEVGDKTDPIIHVEKILAPESLENINQTVKDSLDPVIEKIVHDELPHLMERIVKEEVTKVLEDIIRKEAQKNIEKVAWEVIPDLAENVIQDQLRDIADNILKE